MNTPNFNVYTMYTHITIYNFQDFSIIFTSKLSTGRGLIHSYIHEIIKYMLKMAMLLFYTKLVERFDSCEFYA